MINQELLLKEYSQSPGFMQAVSLAEEQELAFAEGIKFGDEVQLKAVINAETGLWEALIEARHGYAIIRERQENISVIDITTISSYNNETRFCDINIKDVHSLKNAKNYFRNDPVLNNIHINTPNGQTVAELLIIFIREYTRLFRKHRINFAFLWEGTGLNNALDLAARLS
jgi:hypothetical protein